MKRRDLEKALLVLETTPLLLRELLGRRHLLLRSAPGGLPGRRLWWMAHLEREVWGWWIEEILAGGATAPELVLDMPDDFGDPPRGADGNDGWGDPLTAFERARWRNIGHLGSIPKKEWSRRITLPGTGPIRLTNLPTLMAATDRRQLAEMTDPVEQEEDHDIESSSSLVLPASRL